MNNKKILSGLLLLSIVFSLFPTITITKCVLLTSSQNISIQWTSWCRQNFLVWDYNIDKIDNLFMNFEAHFKKDVEEKQEFWNIIRE